MLIIVQYSSARSRSRGAATRDLRGASPMGVQKSTSVKFRGILTLLLEPGKPQCIPPNLFEFYLSFGSLL
jgi:hypothetical protein